ncbi:type I secretion system permease/ATPase [Sphingomonas immobilis]|uniref:Type I secretion system permease/ATPase n=1 Tax=Sphingomonas immobilis TaxID=3063997 RepID=A0ABT9A5K1_9SPHN|nr:type I secretion system permease/ATPase [Sphingomonas sp. CA1-15]MDO7844624.1 type I secretion system permease/ATPase [Sphingomonas sp. CA1-15]
MQHFRPPSRTAGGGRRGAQPVGAAHSAVRAALAHCRSHLIGIALFSALLNLLNLAPTIFMMQVYDRVLGSGSVPTLVALTAVCLLTLATLGALDWLRSRLLVRVSARMEDVLASRVMSAVFAQAGFSRIQRADALRQFDTLRQGMGSAGVLAVFDGPWALIYTGVAFLIHPLLGALCVVASVILLLLAWSNERSTHSAVLAANEAASVAYANQSQITAYAAEVRALGMREAMVARQLRERGRSNAIQTSASLSTGNHVGIIKFVRLALQSVALAVGGYLAVKGEISGGAVFAASLLLSKAVQPIEQIVGASRGLLQAWEARRKIDVILDTVVDAPSTSLPVPTGRVDVEHLTVLTAETERVALANVAFTVNPGELIGVIGSSGSGKSTLLRALSGAVAPARGWVRYDGASYWDWDEAQIARHIGYMPQEFVLFPGTLKENISRFAGDLGADPAHIDTAVIRAAQLIGAHDSFVRLPQGYETRIGLGGTGLSAGQTQRVALARALYGDPRVLILDEPNAHLDADAQYGLIQLLLTLKRQGTTVIVAAHTGDLIASVDKVLILNEGRVVRFGPVVTEKNNPLATVLANHKSA